MKIYEPEVEQTVVVPDPQTTVPTRKYQYSRESVLKHKEAAELRAKMPNFNTQNMLKQLRPVHREMVKRIIEGQSSKQIAKDLGFTARYVTFLKNHDPLFMAETERALMERELRVTSRMQNLSGESLDVLKRLMRESKSDQVRLEAAKTVLDRAGYSKLEKRVTLTGDAESVIRELNRHNPRDISRDVMPDLNSIEVEATQ